MLLQGVRVLDLSRVLAGPLCTMMLGDLGADVLKVERPEAGDETRGWGPPFDERGESAYYLSCNRNKLSVAADLDAPGDVAMLRDLAAAADVVVDNFRPGTLERRGLDPAALLAAHPDLVWCTISGFGPESPRPGYDFVVQAERGWMSINGEPGGDPLRAGVALVDVVTGRTPRSRCSARSSAAAAPARRCRRPRAGCTCRSPRAPPRRSSTSLRTCSSSGRTPAAGERAPQPRALPALRRPRPPARRGRGHRRAVAACARALDLAELADDPRLATNAGRLAHRAALVAALSAQLATRPAAEWLARLDAAGVPAGEVRTVLEALAEVDASPLTGVAPSVPGGSVRRPPPRLDEHGGLVRARGWQAFAQT
jgi:crotonobetainyl-CoA:carnitine CoA-transferase CaiB-like acyl-CoA transferase